MPSSNNARKSMLALALGGFICFALLYTTQPLLPQLSTHFGVSPASASLSVTAGTSAMSLLLIPFGLMADRYGREKMMRLGLTAAGIFSIASAFATDFSLLVLFRIGVGASIAAYPALAMGYLGDEIPQETHGKAMGLYISANALGGMSGRFVAGFLSECYDRRTALLLLGVAGFLAALVFWRALPSAQRFSPGSLQPAILLRDVRKLFSDPCLPWLFVTGFLIMGSFLGIYNYLGFRLSAAPYFLGPTAIGAFFLLYAVGSVSSTWAGQRINRLGRQRLILYMSLTMSVGVLITLFSSIVLIIAGLGVFTFGYFGLHAVASGWVGQRGGTRKSLVSSLYLSSYYLGGSVIGSATGWPWLHGGWTAVVASLLVYTSALSAIALRLRHSDECVR